MDYQLHGHIIGIYRRNGGQGREVGRGRREKQREKRGRKSVRKPR